MIMNYYIQGDATKAQQIKAAFERNGIDTSANSNYGISNLFYYSYNGEVAVTQTRSIINLIKTHPDYKELELPVEPKFKVGYEIIEIYRVVCDENYNQVMPETHWCLDKKQCEDYIAASSYKHCLRIEKSTLSSKAIKL